MDLSDVSVIPKVDVVGRKGRPQNFFGSDLKRELDGGSIHHPSKLGKAEVRSSKLFPSVLGET